MTASGAVAVNVMLRDLPTPSRQALQNQLQHYLQHAVQRAVPMMMGSPDDGEHEERLRDALSREGQFVADAARSLMSIVH